jgi:hypothetical protein
VKQIGVFEIRADQASDILVRHGRHVGGRQPRQKSTDCIRKRKRRRRRRNCCA